MMEQVPQPNKKVVGKHTEQQKNEYLEKISDFDSFKNRYPVLVQNQIEKTEKEKLYINSVNMELALFARQFTNEIKNISVENYLKMPEDFLNEGLSREVSAFVQLPFPVIIYKVEKESDRRFIHRIAHESAHLQSKLVDQLDVYNDRSHAAPYRIGFEVISRGASTRYLTVLNEVMTEQISRVITEKVSKNFSLPEYDKDKIREYNTHRIENGEQTVVNEDENYYVGAEHSFENSWVAEKGYLKETKAFEHMVERISERLNWDKTKVLSVCHESYFTGHLLSFAKMLDQAFGEGTFEKLGRVDNISARPSPKQQQDHFNRVVSFMYSL